MANVFTQDPNDLADDARQLLRELDREHPGIAAVSSECRPAVDVIETSRAVEVVVDVPGVPVDSLKVALRRSTLLIVGTKLPAPNDPAARFHVAERSYGRFARAVRISGAFDGLQGTARTSAGQLRVVLPRIDERRGRVRMIPVATA